MCCDKLVIRFKCMKLRPWRGLIIKPGVLTLGYKEINNCTLKGCKE